MCEFCPPQPASAPRQPPPLVLEETATVTQLNDGVAMAREAGPPTHGNAMASPRKALYSMRRPDDKKRRRSPSSQEPASIPASPPEEEEGSVHESRTPPRRLVLRWQNRVVARIPLDSSPQRLVAAHDAIDVTPDRAEEHDDGSSATAVDASPPHKRRKVSDVAREIVGLPAEHESESEDDDPSSDYVATDSERDEASTDVGDTDDLDMDMDAPKAPLRSPVRRKVAPAQSPRDRPARSPPRTPGVVRYAVSAFPRVVPRSDLLQRHRWGQRVGVVFA
ncbi:hypothetical protein PsYK624_085570 [Phanerochaete sordida]|uniref:Uncharacterized protein n=1 Tax=Phanerochaete sordida TaxID=48140 RepID=A0A9P3GAF4_9APHY|nr:hypothetical protein PsYK624_085570 [Phanerochaete sordida]